MACNGSEAIRADDYDHASLQIIPHATSFNYHIEQKCTGTVMVLMVGFLAYAGLKNSLSMKSSAPWVALIPAEIKNQPA
ncbi:hypothetical protein [Macromonas bipunctata]|uniref:hypothetical protein n=1 Tax=Macromonas bipunctata TaxID=183670 RepID=UPI0011AF32DD|nr:hypothetical protein [Macromonas bipunctata]